MGLSPEIPISSHPSAPNSSRPYSPTFTAPIFYSHLVSLFRRWHCRRSRPISWQNLEVQNHQGLAGLVVGRVTDVTRFKEIISRIIDCGLARLHIRELSAHHEAYPRPRLVMLADVSAGLVGRCRGSQFILAA